MILIILLGVGAGAAYFLLQKNTKEQKTGESSEDFEILDE